MSCDRSAVSAIVRGRFIAAPQVDAPATARWAPRLLETYAASKRADLEAVEGLPDVEAYARHAEIY